MAANEKQTNEKRTVLGVRARVYVDDLEGALPLYIALSDGAEPHRFEYAGMKLAKIGSFLLVQGADAEVRAHTATIAVSDIDAVAGAVTSAGGQLLEGPAPGPNGARLIARHPDGSVLEYIETASR